MKLLVEMTTICPVDEVEELLDDEADELAAEELLSPPPSPPADAPVALEPVPLEPVEADPEPELLLLLDTCWPTLRSTEATVPAMVDVNEALVRLVWAVVSWDCAEVTDAWSDVIWLDEALAA
jgi:hypothetical protein